MSLPEKQSYHETEYEHSQPSEQPKQLLEAVPPMVPQSRLKKVSKLEKIIFAAFIVTLLFLSIATIKITTAINKEEQLITSVKSDMDDNIRTIEKLEQEKNELLRAERVKTIAGNAGIELHEDNIRKIK